MAAVKMRGETPFPEFGEGVMLLYRNADLAVIEEEFGENWFNEIVRLFMEGRIRMKLVMRLLEVGLKTADRKPLMATEEQLDALPVNFVCDKIFDALCISRVGKSAREYVDEVMEAFRLAVDSGEDDDSSPQSSPEDTSAHSGDAASAPGSE